jgi:hypothetical protein
MWPYLSPYRYAFYRSSQSLSSILWALLLDFFILSGLASLFFFYLQRRKSIDRSVIWILVAARVVAELAQAHSSQSLLQRHASGGIAFGGTLLAGVGLRFLALHTYRKVANGLAFVLTLVGLSALWIVPELLYMAAHQRGGDAVMAESSLAAPSPARTSPQRRVIWIVFDELSYNQAFEHRFPGLAMPAFDRLRSQSFLFENVQPAGGYTDIVLPALFLGNKVEDIKSDADGRSIVRIAGKKGWSVLDPQATIFAEAQRQGWTTGVAGWWNPYCRMLAGVLDSCYWSTEETNGIFSAEKSVLENAAAPVLSRVGWSHSPPVEEKHRTSLQQVMQQAKRLIADQNIALAFIHLPVPHPPGIYDRRTGTLRDRGTYIDNLALADRVLGELSAALDATPAAPETTLIVCSDHSWRVGMWKADANWSPEEAAASQGKFDARPLLMIRLPQQTAPVAISRPFDQISLHSILRSLLKGELATPGEFEAWLNKP